MPMGNCSIHTEGQQKWPEVIFALKNQPLNVAWLGKTWPSAFSDY